MKIITAHIKKACAEKRIIMEKIKKNVSNIKIKDPGSAITHFIAMLMGLFAATPLIIKALSAPDTIHVISLSIFIGTMILLYAASTTICHVAAIRCDEALAPPFAGHTRRRETAELFGADRNNFIFSHQRLHARVRFTFSVVAAGRAEKAGRHEQLIHAAPPTLSR